MLYYKIDILAALKSAGLKTPDLRREKLLPESAAQKIRTGQMIGIITLDKICALLDMQPGDLIGYRPDDQNEKNG